jgi:hypothetical protein
MEVEDGDSKSIRRVRCSAVSLMLTADFEKLSGISRACMTLPRLWSRHGDGSPPCLVRLFDEQTTVACFLVLPLQSHHHHPGLVETEVLQGVVIFRTSILAYCAE